MRNKQIPELYYCEFNASFYCEFSAVFYREFHAAFKTVRSMQRWYFNAVFKAGNSVLCSLLSSASHLCDHSERVKGHRMDLMDEWISQTFKSYYPNAYTNTINYKWKYNNNNNKQKNTQIYADISLNVFYLTTWHIGSLCHREPLNEQHQQMHPRL